MSTPPLRIVLAEDDVLLREGLASLFERIGFQVLGRTGDAAGLLELVATHRPDVAVIDIRLPPTQTTEGLEAARAVRAEHPETAVLVLSAYVELEEAMELLGGGGGVGYLLKNRVTDVDELASVVQRVAQGGSVIDPGLVRQLVDRRRKHDPLAELTPREREVLELMAEGRSNGGIAAALWVTESTVEKHVGSILVKLGLPEDAGDHRRVLAVLRYLESR